MVFLSWSSIILHTAQHCSYWNNSTHISYRQTTSHMNLSLVWLLMLRFQGVAISCRYAWWMVYWDITTPLTGIGAFDLWCRLLLNGSRQQQEVRWRTPSFVTCLAYGSTIFLPLVGVHSLSNLGEVLVRHQCTLWPHKGMFSRTLCTFSKT